MSAAQWHENNNEACRSDATPAQVTEAHRELARRIMLEFTQAGTATASDVRMAAQFIADSEARAVAEWQDFVHLKGEAIDSLLLECNQLRAECNNLRADIDAIKAIRNEEKARAERAEAELHALRLICGTTEADRFSTWVDRANARAEEAEHDCRVLISQSNVAEVELAAERARLDWLDHNSIPWAWMSPEKIDELGPIVVTWKSNNTLRAAIDAAMKEGA